MRCQDIQENIIEGTMDAAASEHAASCAECRSFASAHEKLRAGLALLARDATPEPSWGFAQRVVRRLGEVPASVFEPLELIGRRAVLAAGALAMTVMLALAISSSSPLRDGGSSGLSFARADASESVETLLAGGVEENEEMSLLPVSLNGAEPR